MKVPIGKLLKEFGYITEEQIQIALEVQRITRQLLGEVLLELAFVSPKEIALAVSRQSDRPFVDLLEVVPEGEALKLISKSVAKQLEIMPFAISEERLSVAMADPYNINAIDIIKNRTKLPVEIFVASKDVIQKTIEFSYLLLETSLDDEIKRMASGGGTGSENTVIPTLLDGIFNMAIINRATDIHISPEQTTMHVFFRIDGVLRHAYTLNKDLQAGIISRVKIISNLNIAEQRLPQDGALTYELFDENYDMRVSTIPTVAGENVVIRILGKNLSMFNLESLGYTSDELKTIKFQLERSQGIAIVTGPTGSGKTTTLYSALRIINSLQKRVLTIENPIEYKFPFIKQSQINEKAGYSFASAMRAFLRQDPDIILVGEMRDQETAEMAMSAAITGHLVLSTMHTNDAVTAILRLVDLGIKPYFIASALSVVIAQRLVRKVCSTCATDATTTHAELIEKGFNNGALARAGITPEAGEIAIRIGAGCSNCSGTGYIGRVAISEILELTPEIGNMISKGATQFDIKEHAIASGMLTLEDSGIKKVILGITTPDEVARVSI